MNTEHPYTERATRFIVNKANQWNCSPKEAVARIIEDAAKYAESIQKKKTPVNYSAGSVSASSSLDNSKASL